MNTFFSTIHTKLGFRSEWTWRLFLALQVAGIVGLVFLRVNTPYWWQILPYAEYGKLKWDLFDSSYWSYYKAYNWWLLLATLGPYLFAIAIDWISEARKK